MYHESKCAHEVFLSIPTPIDTSIDSTVCHLQSMRQATLEAAWQHARHLYHPLIGMCNLGYLPVHSRIPERKFMTQLRTMVCNNMVNSLGSP